MTISSQNSHIHCTLLRKYIQLWTRQNKTLSDNLHSTACKQSHSRVDQNARSLDSERSERAPVDWSGCLRTREIVLLVS